MNRAIMPTQSFLKRIERAEEALRAHFIFSTDCICFPESEPPCFCSPYEEAVAAQVKCSLHGNRFKQPIFHIFMSAWRRETEPARRQRLTAQYRKAWEASFPAPELWLVVPSEETENDQIIFGGGRG